MQAGGPAVWIDRPVAEGTAVVDASREPAVVEHESLDAEIGCELDEGEQLLEPVVVVDGFPGVEDDGTRGRRGQGTHEGMQAIRETVEAVVAVGQHRLRGAVALADREADLARFEQFGRQQPSVPGRERFDAGRAVAAPGVVQSPDLAAAEPESGRSEHGEVGGVMTWSATALVAQMQTVAQGSALRLPLVRPHSAEVEQVCGAGGDRHAGGEPVQLDALGCLTRGSQIHRDDAVGRESHRPGDGEQRTVVVVDTEIDRDRQRVGLGEGGRSDAQRKPRGCTADAVGDDRGESAPALGRPGEDRRGQRMVGRARRDGRRRCDLLEHLGVDVAEIGAPVDDAGYGRAAGVEHEADTRGTEVKKWNYLLLDGDRGGLQGGDGRRLP
jgi:hypothetical protein